MNERLLARCVKAAQVAGLPVVAIFLPPDTRYAVDVQMANRLVYRIPAVDVIFNGSDPEGDFVRLLRAKLADPTTVSYPAEPSPEAQSERA